MRLARSLAVLAAGVCAVASACTRAALDDAPDAAGRHAPARDTPMADALVVASFDFPESSLVAEIYAAALEGAGVPVRRELGLGPRELVQPALAQGFVDLVPEYLGSALRALQPSDPAPAGDATAVQIALANALSPWGVDVLSPAPAQDQNGFAMTRAQATSLGVRRLSDLRDHAAQLVLGGPPECASRPLCLLGLQRVYGLRFASFLPLSSQGLEKKALEQGVIDVAVMFTTAGHLADPELVLLDDDRRLQPPENIVPVVASAAVRHHGARLVETLDAVSARLTTANLRFLNWRIDVAGKDIGAEAQGWLLRHPLR